MEEAVKVEAKPAVVVEEAVKVVAKPAIVEDKMAVLEAKMDDDLGSRTGAVDIGERSAVPAAPIYPTPYSSYYWPYYVPLAAPSQVARSDSKGVVAAVPYYPYPYYGYPYYYAPPVVVAPPPAVKKLY